MVVTSRSSSDCSVRARLSIALVLLLLAAPAMAMSRAPTPSLAERVKGGDKVFAGKVINRVRNGDWVQAELLVEEPLKNVKKGEKVAVIWRVTIGRHKIYDADDGARGVAILDHKHKGRYWLRADKFEDLKKLAEVKKLVAASPRTVLAQATIFGFGVKHGQRPTARKTDGAFAALISSPDGAKQFAELFESKNINAKLYAMCALHHLDRKLYGKLKETMKKEARVGMRDGCCVSDSTVGKILKEIESGRYDYAVKKPAAKKN